MKFASLIVLAIFLVIFTLIVYQLCFDSMQESFITLGNGIDAQFNIEDETEFLNYSDMIDNQVQNNFTTNVTIDNSLNTSLYYKRVNNKDLHFYSQNNKYDWDLKTIALYKNFLKSQSISITDEDLVNIIDKLRIIYNQNMILELMSYETNRHKFYKYGSLVDGSNNLLEPWNDATMTLTGSQYIVKCHNNKLKKYTSASQGSVGTDISLNTLNGLSFPDGICNPCDSLLAPGHQDRYKCKYDLNMKNHIGLSGNGIWNQIWNYFAAPATAATGATGATATAATGATATATATTAAATGAATTVVTGSTGATFNTGSSA